MKILPSLLTVLALMAGTSQAASVLNFNTGVANAVTGDALPAGVVLSLNYAYLETQDAQGDPLPAPSWVVDANAGAVQVGSPSAGGYGTDIDGLALNVVDSPVLLTFNGAVNMSSFAIQLDNSSFGNVFGTDIQFFDSADTLLYSIPVNQSVSGFSVNETFSLTHVSKVVLPTAAYYDNLSMGLAAVPEPSKAMLLGLGALSVFMRRRRA
jgi:hypothetical protein